MSNFVEPTARTRRRVFSLLLKPSSFDCNLRCAYCFYSGKTSLYPGERHPRMSEAVLDAVVRNSLELRADQTSFSWQGGEPLIMGIEFYRKVVELQKKYGAGGQCVGNAVQTNATLINDEWAKLFREYNFLIGASLDGPAELHDYHRKTAAGRGSYDMVVRGIDTLRKHDVEFNILAVVNRVNAHRARDTYDFFMEQGYGYLQFIPVTDIEPETGELSEYSVRPEEYGEFLCELFDRWYENGFPNVSVRMFDALLEMGVTGESPLCTFRGCCDSYLLVEHNGDVYPCDFFAERHWRLGNVLEAGFPELETVPLRRQFASSKAEVPDECRECRWLRQCYGGCLRERAWHDGAFHGHAYLCTAFKRFFAHAGPRLDALREQILAARFPPAIEPVPAGRKAGRNDPCPCGSGRKYKHCCGKR